MILIQWTFNRHGFLLEYLKISSKYTKYFFRFFFKILQWTQIFIAAKIIIIPRTPPILKRVITVILLASNEAFKIVPTPIILLLRIPTVAFEIVWLSSVGWRKSFLVKIAWNKFFLKISRMFKRVVCWIILKLLLNDQVRLKNIKCLGYMTGPYELYNP